MSYPLMQILLRRPATFRCMVSPLSAATTLLHTQPPLQKQSPAIDNFLSNVRNGKLRVGDIQKILSEVVRESRYTHIKDSPPAALGLGIAGLVPFAAVPLLTIMNSTLLDGLVLAQLAYGATVLSFLGGSNWGEAVARDQPTFCRLSWAVTPQLLGWLALTLPTPIGLLVTSGGLSAALANDVLLSDNPQWHKSLRFVLTVGAVGSLFTTLCLYAIY